MKKKLNELKEGYITAVTNSKKFHDMKRIKKSKEESQRAMDYFHELTHNVEGGMDVIMEIAKGKDYNAALTTSIMLFHLDKEKGHDSLMRIVKKGVPNYSASASEALFFLLDLENNHFPKTSRCKIPN